MTKNIILSIVVIGVIAGGVYYFLKKPANQSNSLLGVSSDTQVSVPPVGQDTFQGQATTTSATVTNNPSTASTGSPQAGSGQANTNPKSHMITIETNYGAITFETYDSDAPNTVKNF